MGGMDYRKGAVGIGGPYHGHGPEQRRLHSKFDHATLKRDEMNIEVAPNVDHVSADILVGDTRSNQHLARNEQPDHCFGTSFGPTAGFTRQHRTVSRQEEISKPTTFSLSAKTDNSAYRRSNTSRTRDIYSIPPSFHGTHPPSTDLAGYTSQTVTNYASRGSTGKRTGTGAGNMPYGKTEQTWIRSQSTAPTERYEWANENIEKEVTIETLLNDKALIAQKRSMTPEWQSRSFEKHNHWKNRSDPRFARSQVLYLFHSSCFHFCFYPLPSSVLQSFFPSSSKLLPYRTFNQFRLILPLLSIDKNMKLLIFFFFSLLLLCILIFNLNKISRDVIIMSLFI